MSFHLKLSVNNGQQVFNLTYIYSFLYIITFSDSPMKDIFGNCIIGIRLDGNYNV